MLKVVPKKAGDSTGRFAYALWHALNPIGGKFDKKLQAWVIPDSAAAKAEAAIAKFPALKLVQK